MGGIGYGLFHFVFAATRRGAVCWYVTGFQTKLAWNAFIRYIQGNGGAIIKLHPDLVWFIFRKIQFYTNSSKRKKFLEGSVFIQFEGLTNGWSKGEGLTNGSSKGEENVTTPAMMGQVPDSDPNRSDIRPFKVFHVRLPRNKVQLATTNVCRKRKHDSVVVFFAPEPKQEEVFLC